VVIQDILQLIGIVVITISECGIRIAGSLFSLFINNFGLDRIDNEEKKFIAPIPQSAFRNIITPYDFGSA
jgi:hypothetical protein